MTQATYRKIVEQMWLDQRIDPTEVTTLASMQAQLGISEADAEAIEREVIGMTKEEALVVTLGTNLPPPASTSDAGADEKDRTISHQRTSANNPTPIPDAAGTLAGQTLDPAGSSDVQASHETPPIRGRYEVLEALGRGGMGEVFKVRDTRLDELRALKILAPEHSNRHDLLDRMRREVKLCQRLRHPGIVQVFDFDTDETTGRAFFCMEYVDGQTLRQWLKSLGGRRATLEQAEKVLAGITDALDHAHSRSVVHLDLKPDNVMVSADLSQVRVLDFGISRAVDTEGLQTVLTGAGTPYYMAPEQERGDPNVGHHADIYALGAITYELLTGNPPRGSFEPPNRLRPEVPDAWSAQIMRAMHPDPAQRPTLRGMTLTEDRATTAASASITPTNPHADAEALKPVRLPDMGEGIAEGEIISWKVPAGQAVDEGDALVEVMTDKATVTMTAPFTGVIAELIVAEGDVVSVGSIIAVIDARAAATGRNNHLDALREIYLTKPRAERVNFLRARVLEIDAWEDQAKEGHAFAQFLLACIYQEGIDREASPLRAVAWYLKAAEQGLAEAQVSLAHCYYESVGVPADVTLAIEWMTKAAQQGDEDARETVEQWSARICDSCGKPLGQGATRCWTPGCNGNAPAMKAKSLAQQFWDGLTSVLNLGGADRS